MTKLPRRSHRHSLEERARILATAELEGLSGPKAAKKFGISTLTFYKWRKRAGSPPRTRANRGHQTDGSLAMLLRAEVRAWVASVLPDIVHEEVGVYLSRSLHPKRGT